ncbi:MAG: hypothetical protein RQ868_05235 [Meiothermus sp.]|uniref:hypothetical protein n=1 Tax=Meiothermus sp. TaxID=1955249 RepID=UPI0028CC6CC6|nr:hypothetical protein [Meiothermus sp.]MDT7919977.1 hypothetical protein [Meiothermus sp.]
MRSLQRRIQDFLAEPLPDEIALNHNPESLTELVLNTYASGQPFDTGLIKMAQICLGELDHAIAEAASEQRRTYLITCRKLLVEVLQELNVQPENFIAVPKEDAQRLGLRDGQMVKVVSQSNPEGVWDLGNGLKKPMIGKVKVVAGLRPGNVAFSLGYGHWVYGATDLVINGQVIKGDPRRATGIHANAAMRVDPLLKDVTLSDLTGGSAVFYDSKVRLQPV